MTYEEFVARVADEKVRHPDWREGQTAWNTLAKTKQPLIAQLHGSEMDPYYLDERLPAFWAWVEEHWETA